MLPHNEKPILISFFLLFLVFSASPRFARADEMVNCCIDAAIEFNIPADILLAIAEIEGGQPGIISKNKNGTIDIGPMQFNSVYLMDLKKYGITPEMVNSNGCYPYRLAAWRIRQHLENDTGDIFRKAANYHSRTPDKNQIYRNKIISRAERWAAWISSRNDFDVILWK